MAGVLIAIAALGAPILTTSLTADSTLGNDVQSPSAYGSGVLGGLLSISDTIGDGSFALSYAPRLALSSPHGSGVSQVNYFQGTTASFDLREGTQRYSLSETFLFGEQDFSLLGQGLAPGLAGTAPPPPQAGQPGLDRLPRRRFISTLSSSTTASVLEHFSRLLVADARATFTVGGGQGSFGRATLPLQRSATLGVNATYIFDRLNSVALTATGRSSVTGADLQSRAVDVMVRWARSLDPDVRATAGVGLTLVYNGAATAANGLLANPGDLLLAPTAQASLGWDIPVRSQHLGFAADGNVQPALDPFSGVTYLRGLTRLSATWSPVPDWTLTASGSGDRILGGTLAGAWGAGADASLMHRLSPSASVHLGTRLALVSPTRLLGPTEDPVHQWTVLAGFTGTFPGVARR